MSMYSGSLVEYIYDAGGSKPYKCGYCRSQDTSLTQGLLGFKMTCQDYQDLVDRGFQRSGRYVYRADMKRTCCPQYVIRMDVTEFSVTKSQKRAIKRFNEYLLHGKRYDQKTPLPMDEDDGISKSADVGKESPSEAVDCSAMDSETQAEDVLPTDTQSRELDVKGKDYSCQSAPTSNKQKKQGKPKKAVQPGVGADSTKPPCRKAKLVRRERKAQKLAAKQQQMDITSGIVPPPAVSGSSSRMADKVGFVASPSEVDNTDGVPTASASKGGPKLQQVSPAAGKEGASPSKFAQDLRQALALPNEAHCKHKFETRLVRIKPRSNVFMETYSESYAVFKKFQMIIHRETEEDSTERHFEDFLVQTPLENEEVSEQMPCMYGTYHQQYLLDGKIFAVGVLDILPRGILCEYLYYDPDYRFIAPGVYTALQEIAFTQQLFEINPQMQYYYMGFYVQSCPKMNYKSRYRAGYLLCPETYQYVPIAKCVPILKASPYSRLADEDVPNAREGCTEEELNAVPTLANMSQTTFAVYRAAHGEATVPLVKEYIDLVGLEVAMRMNLFIGRRFFF